MTTRAETIAALNDALRRTFKGGKVLMTAGVQTLSETTIAGALTRLRSFDAFDGSNDPHGEHDFGQFEAEGYEFFFKIDYYDLGIEYGSPDPCACSCSCSPRSTSRSPHLRVGLLLACGPARVAQ
jgi:hypothetical protein